LSPDDTNRSVRRYVTAATVVALVALGAGWLLLPGSLVARIGWLALGWALMAVGHVAGGAWMVARHGSAGSAFLVAMGSSMFLRFTLAVAGAVAAWFAGESAAFAYVAGLGLGFVPLQVLDSVWFLKAVRARATSAATQG
jgi:hypothetical protein